MGEVKFRVTIHESEEDYFRNEFSRNSNPKGFKDTKWKRNYYGMVRLEVSIILKAPIDYPI